MRKINDIGKYIITFLLVGFLWGNLAVFADDRSAPPILDRYIRISVVSGSVDIQPSASSETMPARINIPFLPGDRLLTGDDGAAELQLDNGSNVWVWHDTKLDLTQLGSGEHGVQETAFHLWIGEIYVRAIRQVNEASKYFVILSDDVRFHLTKPGLIRIDKSADGSVSVWVNDGKGVLDVRGNMETVDSGNFVEVDPEGSVRISKAEGKDTFDEWAAERDRLLLGQYESSEHVPDNMKAAAAELDRNGRWIYSIYLGGWVWVPYVSAGWVPYHYGYWWWYPCWGWTWIPDEPWGWFAFHFGYWAFYYEYGWVWVPHWHWGPHWAAWRCYGRSVHWVPIHPHDRLDAKGYLAQDAVPINSTLSIGIPVETGESIDDLMAGKPVQTASFAHKTLPAGVPWTSEPVVVSSSGKHSGIKLSPIRPVPRRNPYRMHTKPILRPEKRQYIYRDRRKGLLHPSRTMNSLPKKGKSISGFWNAVSGFLSGAGSHGQPIQAMAAPLRSPGLVMK